MQVFVCKFSSIFDVLYRNLLKPRKSTRPKGVENDESVRPLNLSSSSFDLDLWPPHLKVDSFMLLRRGPFVPICIKISSFGVHKFGDGRTNGWTNKRTRWEQNASACQSDSYLAPTAWSGLPLNIRLSSTTKTFKTERAMIANLVQCALLSWHGWSSGWQEWNLCPFPRVRFQLWTAPLLPSPADSTWPNTLTYLFAH